jgi:hypothetical protein
MNSSYIGAEQVTEEDRAYVGSRFSEVRAALFANPYQKVWGGPSEPLMPVYDVTLASVLRGVPPFGPPYFFRQAVARAVDSRADLRWGAERRGFRRIIHPNGICLTGLWEITERTPPEALPTPPSQTAAVFGKMAGGSGNWGPGCVPSDMWCEQLVPLKSVGALRRASNAQPPRHLHVILNAGANRARGRAAVRDFAGVLGRRGCRGQQRGDTRTRPELGRPEYREHRSS